MLGPSNGQRNYNVSVKNNLCVGKWAAGTCRILSEKQVVNNESPSGSPFWMIYGAVQRRRQFTLGVKSRTGFAFTKKDPSCRPNFKSS